MLLFDCLAWHLRVEAFLSCTPFCLIFILYVRKATYPLTFYLSKMRKNSVTKITPEEGPAKDPLPA